MKATAQPGQPEATRKRCVLSSSSRPPPLGSAGVRAHGRFRSRTPLACPQPPCGGWIKPTGMTFPGAPFTDEPHASTTHVEQHELLAYKSAPQQPRSEPPPLLPQTTDKTRQSPTQPRRHADAGHHCTCPRLLPPPPASSSSRWQRELSGLIEFRHLRLRLAHCEPPDRLLLRRGVPRRHVLQRYPLPPGVLH